MPKRVTLRLEPERVQDASFVRTAALQAAGVSEAKASDVQVVKRSVDARQRRVMYQLQVDIYLHEEVFRPVDYSISYPDVHNSPAVAVVGMGPAGLFAALRLIERGFRPVIFERGKDVRARRRDLAKLSREHLVNPDSNYCFGEGGAGTYSDGKLYTRSGKRGNIREVLHTLVAHGASEDILVDAHPHIGTNKLPGIITNMRETVINAGGEVRFDTRVTDFIIEDRRIAGVETASGSFRAEAVILATGHSARDIFHLLHRKRIAIEAKPFALGVRVEHPQRLIDQIQYHGDRGEVLPPASYALVCQVGDKGVYSFCMCPGGIIAPCATSPGEIVTNGWSPSKRNNPFANSGIVVSIEEDDLKSSGFEGPLAALHYQSMVEQKCCEAAGSTQTAPAQRLIDFIENRPSTDLPNCSYQPGVTAVNLREVLPPKVGDRLAAAFVEFGKKMRGYLTNEAVVVAPESRTSSPVRIPRDSNTLCHPEVSGLYPCGEGAGYAGGIVSAAMDGQKVAEAIAINSKSAVQS